MYSAKGLKKYLGATRLTKALAWLFFAASAVLIVASACSFGSEDEFKASAVRFDPIGAEKKSSAFIDVVGVSDWIYKYDSDTYYAAEDSEGYLYVVQLPKGTFDAMKAQQEYWERSDENAPMPVPFRLSGMARDTYDSLAEIIADAFDITEREFKSYFGEKYLDATTYPGDDRGWMFASFAIFTVLFWLICVIVILSAKSMTKKSLRRLECIGELENAVAEFEAQNNESINKNNIKISEHFIFARKVGAVVSFGDIKKAYRHIITQDGSVLREAVMVETKDGRKISIDISKKEADEQAERILGLIAERNPEAAIGYNS